MYATAYEMKMPTNYVDMEAKELRYDAEMDLRDAFDEDYSLKVVDEAIKVQLAER